MWFCMVSVGSGSQKSSLDIADLVKQEADIEYAYIEKQIYAYQQQEVPSCLAEQSLNPQFLIFSSDKDPLDVLLRRTETLLTYLRTRSNAPVLTREQETLMRLGHRAENTSVQEKTQRRMLFSQLITLRRRIAFKNPLLDFDSLIFLTHHKARYNHMCDQYFGFHAKPGGGIYVVDGLFSNSPRVRNLLADARVSHGRLKGRHLDKGSFISLELDYDARTIYFAWTEAQAADSPYSGDTGGKWTCQDLFDEQGIKSYWNVESTYHIFKIQIDGTGLTQLIERI